MPARIVPLIPLHAAIENVLDTAEAFVDAVHHRDLYDTDRAYFALQDAVDAEALARDAHVASLRPGRPILAVIEGGLAS
jgi:hypothetical protein